MKSGKEVGQLSPKKGGTSPQFSAHACCGQTVAHLSYCWALVNIFHCETELRICDEVIIKSLKKPITPYTCPVLLCETFDPSVTMDSGS